MKHEICLEVNTSDYKDYIEIIGVKIITIFDPTGYI